MGSSAPARYRARFWSRPPRSGQSHPSQRRCQAMTFSIQLSPHQSTAGHHHPDAPAAFRPRSACRQRRLIRPAPPPGNHMTSERHTATASGLRSAADPPTRQSARDETPQRQSRRGELHATLLAIPHHHGPPMNTTGESPARAVHSTAFLVRQNRSTAAWRCRIDKKPSPRGQNRCAAARHGHCPRRATHARNRLRGPGTRQLSHERNHAIRNAATTPQRARSAQQRRAPTPSRTTTRQAGSEDGGTGCCVSPTKYNAATPSSTRRRLKSVASHMAEIRH
jgi:hypothetical protein